MEFILAASEAWSPIILVGTGLVVGLPGTYLGYKAYRRGKEADKAAAQAVVIATHTDTVQLVQDGLNSIIDGLHRSLDERQAANVEARKDVAALTERLAECREACAALQRAADR